MGAELRSNAISSIAQDNPIDAFAEGRDEVADTYGIDTFSISTMRKYLSKDVFKSLKNTIKSGDSIDAEIADEVAHAMKNWSMSRGASHYTHWFQPLTGSTAEKHDSFIEPDYEGGVVMNFSGKELIQGEPDASSFPNGGIRATFEARGYTAWDPTSPAFIKRDKNGATLCIPTAFCSYTGEALDQKTPLLRSIQAISKQTTRLLNLFGKEVKVKVSPSLGAEQEYFLVDKKLYMTRPDLIQTGRTLFGRVPAKHQQMDDHYFGAIKARVLDFMSDADRALWKLGIPAKTRHNEVAPAQFELAAQFDEVNVAVDHNMMIMEVLRQVAERHGLICLMHEKPFEGVNGSGKHNNWSLSYDGINLLEPGKNPHDNALFLTVLSSVIKAVDTHPELLRIAAASAGNDHRLGANEAPPAIISIFLGEQLEDVIGQIEAGGAESSTDKKVMNIGADILPKFARDVTDRNRTSPFAFTGNKFEFRALGSNMNPADSNTFLNTMVADAISEICDGLEKLDESTFDDGLQAILQKIIKDHKRVVFNGDNYADAWVDEAAKRGLPNLRTTPEALDYLVSEKTVNLFSTHSVLSSSELESRCEVLKEQYETKIEIEGVMASEIIRSQIIPVAVECQTKLADAFITLKETGVKSGIKAITKNLEVIGDHLDKLSDKTDELDLAVENNDSAAILAHMLSARVSVDALEGLVDDEIWPLAKYRELLFVM
jgi:glutamine synthetase